MDTPTTTDKKVMENNETKPETGSGNNLFPVFIKLEELKLLIVGGGNVGLEKLQTVLQNSPTTPITLVAPEIIAPIRELAGQHLNITLVERPWRSNDLEYADIAIVAVNDRVVSETVARHARERGILVNVADTPDLCDFYLGSVVRRGNLKIAISTNGKSPTIAKRLKEEIGNMIPEEMDAVLDNMQTIRTHLNGDFAEKVRRLNDLTSIIASSASSAEALAKADQPGPGAGGHAPVAPLDDLSTVRTAKQERQPLRAGRRTWQQVVKWCIFAFVFMIIGHAILSLIPLGGFAEFLQTLPKEFDARAFGIMTLAGFLAQFVDGAMGLGYGTISTTFLLAYGVSPAIVSSRVHSARVFSSGVSGYSHHRFGNINKKLFRTIVIPGVIGAILGATLACFGKEYSNYVRIPLSFYTIYLGYYIVRKAFARRKAGDKVRRAGWLASIGGLMDAFAGGGWGTLVTSTLISKRKNPRYVIGSVCLAEFFVVLASAITFFILLRSIPLLDIAGLIAGGVLAAPVAARLAGKLPARTMFIAVGSLVILTSCNTLWKSLQYVIHHF
ncbi:MAG TPA: TSUP family transporter [Puia sp.]|nr:TSUP family transporter [Puia sp.]